MSTDFINNQLFHFRDFVFCKAVDHNATFSRGLDRDRGKSDQWAVDFNRRNAGERDRFFLSAEQPGFFEGNPKFVDGDFIRKNPVSSGEA